MKVTAFCGSPRKNGNTAFLINKVFEQLNTENIDTELVHIANEPMKGCQACRWCVTAKNNRCVCENDGINLWIEKMINSDGIIIGSPVYFADVSGQTKTFIDRIGYVARANNFLFENKIGAAVVAVRRAGALPSFNTINNFLLANKFIVPGSSYWNLALARDIGDAEHDNEGIANMEDLGKKMAWLIKKLK